MKLKHFIGIYKIERPQFGFLLRPWKVPNNSNTGWNLRTTKASVKGRPDIPFKLLYQCSGSAIDNTRLTGLIKTDNYHTIMEGNIRCPKSGLKEFFYIGFDYDLDLAYIMPKR